MKKRALAIVAATVFAISAVGAPVAADEGGVPNGESCHGMYLSLFSPGQIQREYGISVKDQQDLLRWADADDGWAGFGYYIICLAIRNGYL
jgi:hypothetical protein